MFRRDHGLLHPRRLRELVVPRKGWSRGIRYLTARLRRLPGSPHSIALGFACGVLASFTPFFGLHILLAMALAWILRVSVVASALGTAVGNPLTFPLIVTTAIGVGRRLLGLAPPAAGTEEPYTTLLQPAELAARWHELLDSVLLPYAVGGMAIGFPIAVGGYLLLRSVVAGYQLARLRLRLRREQASRRRSRTVVAVKPGTLRS